MTDSSFIPHPSSLVSERAFEQAIDRGLLQHAPDVCAGRWCARRRRPAARASRAAAVGAVPRTTTARLGLFTQDPR